MPTSWTPANDRKFLLLLLKEAQVKPALEGSRPHTLHLTVEIRKAWGPDPPTVKALTLRLQLLKKLARENDVQDNEDKPSKRAGLPTPTSSPKKASKRGPPTPDPEPVPRQRSKRKCAEKVKSYSLDVLESDEEKVLEACCGSEDDSSDVYSEFKVEDLEEEKIETAVSAVAAVKEEDKEPEHEFDDVPLFARVMRTEVLPREKSRLGSPIQLEFKV